MPGSRSEGPRLLPALLALLLAATPASAYRVFFDYDTDGNRRTFQNEAVGVETAPVKIVVELAKGDGSPPWIHFFVHWTCEDDFLLGRGSILNEACCSLPAKFPFTRMNWEKCDLANCWCESSREFIADFRIPVPEGTWEVATLELSRTGYTGKVHDLVEFWIDCPSCNYEPGDESRLIMSIRSETASTEPSTWGRLKSLYR